MANGSAGILREIFFVGIERGPPWGGRQFGIFFCSSRVTISIHALREEGDQRGLDMFDRFYEISIHALHREGDILRRAPCTALRHFNPRPPQGGRLTARTLNTGCDLFQSTPSTGRATNPILSAMANQNISIHALHREGDPRDVVQRTSKALFQSTPSTGRATPQGERVAIAHSISIHALHREGDGIGIQYYAVSDHFNPRPPQGGRPKAFSRIAAAVYFNPRPPQGGRQQNCTMLLAGTQ